MMSVAFIFNILLILLLIAFVAAFFYYKVKKSGADQIVEDSLTREKTKYSLSTMQNYIKK